MDDELKDLLETWRELSEKTTLDANTILPGGDSEEIPYTMEDIKKRDATAKELFARIDELDVDASEKNRIEQDANN